MPVSKRLRFEILRRDNHTCRYCGTSAPGTPLRVDHVVPVALGGTDAPSNLTAACEPCNTGKSSVPPGAPLVADVAKDALRWAQAMQVALEQTQAETRGQFDALVGAIGAVTDKWLMYGWGDGRERTMVPLPDDYQVSIERMWNAGLRDLDFMLEAVGIAMAKKNIARDDRWKYWCGCCWRQMEKLQIRARELLDVEERQWPG